MKNLKKFFKKISFLLTIFANLSCANLSDLFSQSTRFDYDDTAVKEAYFFATTIPKKSGVIYVENFLPRNYSTKGNIDYTEYVQKAFNNGTIIVMPDFPLLINSKGIDIGNDRTVYFQKKTVLRMKANNLSNYYLLRVADKKNVTIINPYLIGDRDSHFGKGGEWGMGISLLGATNVRIINPRISHCWGDGIYIGRGSKTYCENIEIKGGYLDYNRRNGLSVISVNGLKISSLLVSNTFGTAPMAALDFEPNKSDEHLKNIVVENLKTTNNYEYDILCALWKLNNSSSRVDISVHNHYVKRSNKPLTIFANEKGQKKIINGNIVYKRSKWKRAEIESFKSLYKSHDAIEVIMSDLRIDNVRQNLKFKP